MENYFFGMDLGGTNVVIVLMDATGKMLARRSEPTKVSLGPASLVERTADACKTLLAECKIERSNVKGIGIGSPGPLSRSQGRLIKLGNLPGFDNFPLRPELSRRLAVPAVLDNDANAACWGEFWQGAGKNVRDMVMFTLGTGIGGGIVCDGTLIHGSDDNGAELGHLVIQMGGRLCTCGQHGCVEAYASATGTTARAQELLDAGRDSSLAQVYQNAGKLTAKDVFDHAQAGDTLALEVVDGTAQALALTSVNMRHVTEPELVVLAGGMINAGDFLLNKVRESFHKQMWALRHESMEIVYATLGENAGAIGAAGLALYAFEHDQLYDAGT